MHCGAQAQPTNHTKSQPSCGRNKSKRKEKENLNEWLLCSVWFGWRIELGQPHICIFALLNAPNIKTFVAFKNEDYS